MRRFLPLGLVIGLAASALPTDARAQIQRAAPELDHRGAPELLSLDFEGVTRFREDSLAAAVFNRATQCRIPFPLSVVCATGLARDRHFLAPAELRADSVRLILYYYERGYRSAQVEPRLAQEARGARLAFRIEEGPPVEVRTLDVRGMPPGLQKRRLPLAEGDAFDLIRYAAARDTLESRLREHGFAQAVVLPGAFVPTGGSHVEVTYDVEPGPRARFGPIRVIGAERVDSAAVRRMLSFQTGDVYRQSEIRLSARNLFAVDLFRHARITVDSAAAAALPDSLVPVLVQVNEGDPHRVRVGAGVNTEECVNVEGRWAGRNIMGGRAGWRSARASPTCWPSASATSRASTPERASTAS